MQIVILFTLIFSIVIVLALLVQILRIVRKAARTERTVASLAAKQPVYSDNALRQMEDLQALYHELSPRRALPRTRGWPASPDFLRVVMEQVNEHRPKVILELGSGASTIVAAYALEKLAGGKIHSLDHEESYLAVTASRVRDHGLDNFVNLIHAPLIASDVKGQLWYSIENIPDEPIDMLIIDGPPGSTAPLARYPAIPLLFDRLSRSARIIMDDSARKDERECITRWRESHPELGEQSIDCEKGCVVLTRRGIEEDNVS